MPLHKHMESKQLIDITKDQLNRILSFFPRADAKASVVLAIDTGMLALLATNAPPWKALLQWPYCFALLPVLLIIGSLIKLYQGAFPNLEGGQKSLLYFREVAGRTENKFIDEFSNQTEEEYIKDLLGQIWRNSEILKEKFDCLKLAFNFLAAAVLPWVIALTIFVIKNTEATKSLLAK